MLEMERGGFGTGVRVGGGASEGRGSGLASVGNSTQPRNATTKTNY